MAKYVKNFFILSDLEEQIVMAFLRNGKYTMRMSDIIVCSGLTEEQVKEGLPKMAEVVEKSDSISFDDGGKSEPAYLLTEEFKNYGKVPYYGVMELLENIRREQN